MGADSFVRTRGCPICGRKMWYFSDNKTFCMVCEHCAQEWQFVSESRTLFSITADRTYSIDECPIVSFRESYSFLSNFHPCEIRYDGMTFFSSEAAFQAQKCRNPADRVNFSSLSATQAKVLGKRIDKRADWFEVSIPIMDEIIRIKFSEPTLKFMLKSTGTCPIIEANTWGDKFWGIDEKTRIGENHLGKILMQVRSEITEEF